MVPRITEYTVAEAGWDDTVIPTVAKKNAQGGSEMDEGDQLVAEWTPDGKPARMERFSGRLERLSLERQDVADVTREERAESVRYSVFWLSVDSLRCTMHFDRHRHRQYLDFTKTWKAKSPC